MSYFYVHKIESTEYILKYYSLKYKVFGDKPFQAIGLLKGNQCSHTINFAGTECNPVSLLKRLSYPNWHRTNNNSKTIIK